MKTATRRSPVDRDRAIARLRTLTIRTAIASFAAVGGFGALAAVSYDGSPTDITTAAIVSSRTGSTSGATTATTDASTSTTTTTGGSSSTPATAAPTATTGTAQAATGSS